MKTGLIGSEIQLNQQLLNTIHENNSKIVTLISAGSSDGDNQFVPGLQIQDTAWRTAVATGVTVHIEYEMLHRVSAAYSLQEVYLSSSYQLVQNIMSTTALASVISAEGFVDLADNLFLDNMQLIVLTEEGLKMQYQAALEKLIEGGYITEK